MPDVTQINNPAEFDNGAFRINMKGMAAASPIDVAPGEDATIYIDDDTTLTSSGGAAGIHVPVCATLTITSRDGQTDRTLIASVTSPGTSGYAGAGIGGNSGEDAGTITITGGTGTATITLDGASIVLSGGAGASLLDLADSANLTLRLSGDNTLTAGNHAAGIRITTGRTLTITSSDGDGQIKGNRHYRRFLLRGREKVACEWGLLVLGCNIRRLARMMRQKAAVPVG